MRRARFARAVEIGGESAPDARRSARRCGSTSARPRRSDEASLADWRVAALDHVALAARRDPPASSAPGLLLSPAAIGGRLSLRQPAHSAGLVAAARWRRGRRCCMPRPARTLPPHTVIRGAVRLPRRRSALLWMLVRPSRSPDDTFMRRRSLPRCRHGRRHRHGARSSRSTRRRWRSSTLLVVDRRRAFVREQPADRRRGIAALSLVTRRLQRRRRADGHRQPAASGSTSTPGAQGAALRRRVREQRPRLVLGNQLPRAPCPTSRSSSPTISNASREELLGRQFTDLLSVDTSAGDSLREERKTLGFHLSARFPFSDVVVRAGERRGRPLVAVGQPDLRRARPLPRLPRHRHRPHRAAPLRAGNHAASPASIR